MFSKWKSSVARVVAAGVSLAALGGASTWAGTVQSPSIVSVQSNGNRCFVEFSAQVTGTTNDANGSDLVRAGIGTVTGARYPTDGNTVYPGQVAQVGQTENFVSNSTSTLNIQRGQHEQAYLNFWDISQANPNPGPANQVASVLIPDALLETAGGACLRLRVNNAPVVASSSDNLDASPYILFMGRDSLVATAEDEDNDPLTSPGWMQLSGPPVTITQGTNRTATFPYPGPRTNADQVFVFEYEVNDGFVTGSVQVTKIIRANEPPVARAGDDATISPGQTVSLAANRSFDQNSVEDPLTFSWTQVSGTPVSIANPSVSVTSFTAPPRQATDQILVFQVEVTDPSGATDTDTVTYTLPANLPPTVNAGADQIVAGSAAVELSGSATDPEGDPFTTVQWTQTAGPTVTLSTPNNFGASFTAPAKTNNQQVLTFQLAVTDNQSNTGTDSTNVTVAANVGPTANAGANQAVSGGAAVSLDGSGSTDGDGDAITYSWVQSSGPSVTLAGANTATPSFTAPPKTSSVQTLVFDLTVNDGLATSVDQVTVTIAVNGTPVADAGADRTIAGSSTVTLDATGSADPDGDPLTFSFTQVSGPGVTLNNANTATPSFTAPARTASVQTLVFEVTVSDGIASATDQVTLTIAANTTPVANAGPDQTVSGGSTVTLDATGSSDPDGDPLTFSFTQTAGPTVTLTGANTATPSFTAPQGTASSQTLSFEVTVSDGVVSATDAVVVTVNPNGAPVADAGPDQGPVDSGQTVTLNGSGSSDPDNNPLTYRWSQLSGTPATLSDPAAQNPTFTAPAVNGNDTLVFQLIVNDGQVDSPADTVQVTVRALGTITIVQDVQGGDATVAYTSDVAALNTSVTSSGGTATLTAANVVAGSYSLTVGDVSGQGFALTGLACNDGDSAVDVTNRSIALALSPSEDLVCTVTLIETREVAQSAIRDFVSGRNALLLANQPDMQRRLDRVSGRAARGGTASAMGMTAPGSGQLPVNMQASETGMRLQTSRAMASGPRDLNEGPNRVDVWADATLADVTIGAHEGRFSLVYLGADMLVSDTVLIGGLIQLDGFERDGAITPGAADGEGWMVGPYVTARVAPSLYVDARVAWGRSDNSISPLGTYVDDFETERLLFSGSVVGEVALNERSTMWPEVSLRYIREEQQAYVDSFNVTIPGQTIDQGELAFSPRFDYRMDLDDGWTMRPFAEIEGVLTFGAEDNSVIDNGLRGRVAAGFDAGGTGGVRFNLRGFFDGIGEDDFRSAGATVGISLTF